MMYKCKNACPQGKFEGCCYHCPDNGDCTDMCELSFKPEECADAIDEEKALVEFGNQQLALLQKIVTVVNMKKQCEEQEKELKDQLKQAMENHCIKKFESDILNITYVAETTASSIDSAKLKKLHPEIAEECSKVSKKSAYVKVEVKGMKK